MYEQIRKCAAAVGAAFLMLNGSVPAASAEEAPQLRLMCLGDSITDGFWMQGGYRITLCSLLTENGQAEQVDFVGPNWGGSCYDPQHAGYSGYSIDNIPQEESVSGSRVGISSFIDSLMETHEPDLVFLQIGTNDILSLYQLETFGERLESLVDRILAALPEDGALYLATLPVMDATNTLYISEYFFTVDSMDAAVESCNAQIRAVAEKKQAEGKRLVLAEINRLLTKDDLFDGVHPSEEGYRKMGSFWYTQLSSYLANGLPQGSVTSVQQTTTAVSDTTTTTTTTTAPAAPLLGDVDLNGVIAVSDAVLLSRHLMRDLALNEAQAAQADLNGDRRLNAVDLSLLKQRLMP